ncbi:uncharacterized protein LOC124439422 [Xenia sp. Carnegie-2017]|uniref:uncharacterized protein LOC124439422 n=1 Tax=Xenia sp. Carnegie-2017 TaxID=2897299 RepID=UPI001F04FF9E|nr:uncharacterized protein LOC124439422 [Xenia sp. Carnegie-2017]
MNKLPSDNRLQIARKSSGDVWKINELLDTIKTKIEAREISEGVQSSPQPQHGKNSGGQHQTPRIPTVNAFSTQNTSGKHIQCVYCKQPHFSASFDRVTDVNDRKSILRRDNRCFVCLRIGHLSKNCESKKNCRRCHGAHHQSICEVIKSSFTPSQQKNANDPKLSPTGNNLPETKEGNNVRTATMIDGDNYLTTNTAKTRVTCVVPKE